MTSRKSSTRDTQILDALLLLLQEVTALRDVLVRPRVAFSGKDWLTVEEAAFYCGVSVAQFNAKAPELGLAPPNFMGKKLYEKAALHQAIHDASHWAAGGGRGGAAAPSSPDAEKAMARLARYERRKGLGTGRRE